MSTMRMHSLSSLLGNGSTGSAEQANTLSVADLQMVEQLFHSRDSRGRRAANEPVSLAAGRQAGGRQAGRQAGKQAGM
jgi:hypothetical protein